LDLKYLSRKNIRTREGFNGGISELRRRFVRYEYVGRQDARCITVSHPNGLYVADDFIVTHNSHLALAAAVLLALQFAKIRCVIVRKHYNELEELFIQKLKDSYPEEIFGYHYQDKHKTATFENGSRIIFRAAEREDDVNKVKGLEYHFMVIDEANEFDEMSIYKFLGSLRNANIPGYIPTMLMTGNPGGKSDLFFKSRFINPDYKYWSQFEIESKDLYVFIPAQVYDNKYLVNDQHYVNNLKALPDALRMAWLDGNWDVFDGQFFCHDDQTEVLTNNGFKFFKDVEADDLLAIRKDGYLGYEKPLNLYAENYNGEMVTYESANGLNFSVTPNHRMLVKHRKSGEESFIEAKDLKRAMTIPRAIKFRGIDRPVMTFDEVKYSKRKNIEMRMEDFCELLGWYLSEGCLLRNSSKAIGTMTQNKYRGIAISQTREDGRQRIESLLDRIGLPYHYHGHNYEISSTILSNYFEQFGKMPDKYIPRDILELSPKYLQYLFNGLMYGDGCPMTHDSWTYYTISKQLSTDIQELATKLGRVATVTPHLPKNPTFRHKGKIIPIHASQGYVVRTSMQTRQDGFVNNKFVKRVAYDGKIYCATVPSGVLFTRRQGRCMWSGNSEFSREAHVVDEFDIPQSWERYGGMDIGSSKEHPTVYLRAAQDPRDLTLYVYGEYACSGSIEQAIYDIKDISKTDEVPRKIVDPSAFKKGLQKTYGEMTVSQMFLNEGIVLEKGNNDRVNGWRVVKAWLHWRTLRKPKLRIMANCVGLIRTLPQLRYDLGKRVHSEDLDTTMSDDYADALRYMLVTVFGLPMQSMVDENDKVYVEQENEEKFYLDNTEIFNRFVSVERIPGGNIPTRYKYDNEEMTWV